MNLFKAYKTEGSGSNGKKSDKTPLTEGLVPWTITGYKYEAKPKGAEPTEYKEVEKFDPEKEDVKLTLELAHGNRTNWARFWLAPSTFWKLESIFEASGVDTGEPEDLVGKEVELVTYKGLSGSVKFPYVWRVYGYAGEEEKVFANFISSVERGFERPSEASIYHRDVGVKTKVFNSQFDAEGTEEQTKLPF